MKEHELNKVYIEQLSTIVQTYFTNCDNDKKHGGSFPGLSTMYQFFTSTKATIERITGQESQYFKQIESILDKDLIDNAKVFEVMGVVNSLSSDLSMGYLQTFEQLIHSNMFSDYLEMSVYLLSEDYKDPAAVIAGSTLEVHLRNLCTKNGIDIEVNDTDSVKPKKASELNSHLYKLKVYNKLDMQAVTSWLAIRNDAAHGKYDEYTKEQIMNMVSGIREFLTRNPA